MMLIALTMLAGAITFVTVITVMTSKEPIVVSIDSFADFKLTGFTNSTKYNSFSFVLDNQGKRAIGVRAQDFQLWINGTLNNTWIISRDYELGSLQSYSITATSTSNNESDWISFNTPIKILLIVYGLENSYNQADKSDISATTTIDSSKISVGPLQLNNSISLGTNNSINLLAPGSMNISVLNYGHLNTSYTLDFIVTSVDSNFSTHYLGSSTNLSTQITGYITSAASIGNSPSISIPIILNAYSSSNYTIIVWLKIGSTIQDTLYIFCQ